MATALLLMSEIEDAQTNVGKANDAIAALAEAEISTDAEAAFLGRVKALAFLQMANVIDQRGNLMRAQAEYAKWENVQDDMLSQIFYTAKDATSDAHWVNVRLADLDENKEALHASAISLENVKNFFEPAKNPWRYSRICNYISICYLTLMQLDGAKAGEYIKEVLSEQDEVENLMGFTKPGIRIALENLTFQKSNSGGLMSDEQFQKLVKVVEAYLKDLSPPDHSKEYGNVRRLMGHMYQGRYNAVGGVEHLELAISNYNQALRYITRVNDPLKNFGLLCDLGHAEAVLAVVSTSTIWRDRSITHLEEAFSNPASDDLLGRKTFCAAGLVEAYSVLSKEKQESPKAIQYNERVKQYGLFIQAAVRSTPHLAGGLRGPFKIEDIKNPSQRSQAIFLTILPREIIGQYLLALGDAADMLYHLGIQQHENVRIAYDAWQLGKEFLTKDPAALKRIDDALSHHPEWIDLLSHNHQRPIDADSFEVRSGRTFHAPVGQW